MEKGIAERLAPYGIDTMGKIAHCSLENEDLLFRLFGVNAEQVIDYPMPERRLCIE